MKNRIFCKCGCGSEVTGWSHRLNKPIEYIHGHNTRNLPPKSLETRKNMSLAAKARGVPSGEKSPNWRGGITSLRQRIYHSYESRQWRSDVFTRDDFTCQYCNKRSGSLEAHHIKEVWRILVDNRIDNLKKAMNCSELWNINNGLTLCKKCHGKTKCGHRTKLELLKSGRF